MEVVVVDRIEVLLGRRVRTLREVAGLSQAELADVAGVSRIYVGAIERGEQSASVEILARLAQGLRVRPGALLEEAADDPRPSLSREQAFAAKIASLIKGASGKDLARFEAVARAYFGRARSGVTGKAARDP